MELWSETAWYVVVVWNVLWVVLTALVAVSITSMAGAQTVRRLRHIFSELVVPAIDDKDDPIVRFLAEKAKRDPDVVATWLRENGTKIVELLTTEPDENEAIP